MGVEGFVYRQPTTWDPCLARLEVQPLTAGHAIPVQADEGRLICTARITSALPPGFETVKVSVAGEAPR